MKSQVATLIDNVEIMLRDSSTCLSKSFLRFPKVVLLVLLLLLLLIPPLLPAAFNKTLLVSSIFGSLDKQPDSGHTLLCQTTLALIVFE